MTDQNKEVAEAVNGLTEMIHDGSSASNGSMTIFELLEDISDALHAVAAELKVANEVARGSCVQESC